MLVIKPLQQKAAISQDTQRLARAFWADTLSEFKKTHEKFPASKNFFIEQILSLAKNKPEFKHIFIDANHASDSIKEFLFGVNYRSILSHMTVPPQIAPLVQQAAPKGMEAYNWFAYTGKKPLTLTSQGGSTLVLETGSKFGVRDSSNKKFLRLIGEETGVNKVFTLAFDTVHSLIKNCKPTKAPK